MKTLTNPWKSKFLELVSSSKKSIKITTPFIQNDICTEMLKAKTNSSKIYLITSFNLMYIYNGSIDIKALENILHNKGIIKNYPKLHSKIYLFDNKRAVITSGNLTSGGMVNNYEYGIYIDNEEIVNIISSDFNKILLSEKTGNITEKKLNIVKNILRNLQKVSSVSLPSLKLDMSEENLDTIENSIESVQNSLSGWKLEIFKCLNQIPKQNFTLEDVNKFENDLRKVYPTNKHIKDKIRQQLQYLRDLGLVEFLGAGRYRKLWR